MRQSETLALLDRWIFVLVKVETEFLVPYSAETIERIGRAGGYGKGFIPFLRRVLAALRSAEWAAGTYFPGWWFNGLQAEGRDQAAAAITPAALAPFFAEEVLVDPGGAWFVGPKPIEGAVRAHFLRNLQFDPVLQRYRIRYWLESYFETRYIHHQSPPFRVDRVEPTGEGYRLHLNDGSQQPLLPDSLRLDGRENLYCAVKKEGLPALFHDHARWYLLDLVEERGNGLVLPVADGEVPLRLRDPLEFPGGVAPG